MLLSNGKKTFTESIYGHTYCSNAEWHEINELVTNWDEQPSGAVVIRLSRLSPFDALGLFHKRFGHGSDMDYCAPRVFDGMPIEDVCVYKKGDDVHNKKYQSKYMYMCFDSAYDM
jgi:hypothetical protein